MMLKDYMATRRRAASSAGRNRKALPPPWAGPVALRLIIEGRPAPKKNGDMIPQGRTKNGRSLVIPNKYYVAWLTRALPQLRAQWAPRPTLTAPCRLTVAYYEHPTQRFDLAGVFQAVCDALQEAGVYANDRLVRESGPQIIHRSAERPRVECILETL